MSEPIFHSPSAVGPDRAVGGDRDVERGLRVEMVRRLADGERQQLGEAGAGPGGVFGMGVDPGPDGRPAERHGQQLVACGLDAADRLLDLAGVAPELLAEADRRRVLEMRPTGLDDRPELVGLRGERSCSPTSAGISASSIAIAALS